MKTIVSTKEMNERKKIANTTSMTGAANLKSGEIHASNHQEMQRHLIINDVKRHAKKFKTLPSKRVVAFDVVMMDIVNVPERSPSSWGSDIGRRKRFYGRKTARKILKELRA